MKTKFAIGCLVQWYEYNIIGEYVDSLKDALDYYNGDVHVDFVVCTNQDLEQCESKEQFIKCQESIKNTLSDDRFTNTFTTEITSIADYRRKFNEEYCEKAEVLMWGESDSIIPQQTFTILDNLHKASIQNNNPKYLAFFSTCKMWDESWKLLEHPDFTEKPFDPDDTENWWSMKYVMSKDEMNQINSKTEDLDVRILPYHKFNGCGLVISSEVIKAGANIPKEMFFIHEDTAFMYLTNKILGNIPQYIIKNILLVHNRKHPKKRCSIIGENNINPRNVGEKRKQHEWYRLAYEYSTQNLHNLFNPDFKFYSWENIFKK